MNIQQPSICLCCCRICSWNINSHYGGRRMTMVFILTRNCLKSTNKSFISVSWEIMWPPGESLSYVPSLPLFFFLISWAFHLGGKTFWWQKVVTSFSFCGCMWRQRVCFCMYDSVHMFASHMFHYKQPQRPQNVCVCVCVAMETPVQHWGGGNNTSRKIQMWSLLENTSS